MGEDYYSYYRGDLMGADYYSYYRGDLESYSIYAKTIDIWETVGLLITCGETLERTQWHFLLRRLLNLWLLWTCSGGKLDHAIPGQLLNNVITNYYS